MLITCNNNILTFQFKSKIDYTLFTYFEKTSSIAEENEFLFIDLDFSETKFVTLPGSMYLLLIIHSIVNFKIRRKKNIQTIISKYTDSNISLLSNYGLINQLKFYGNLNVNEEIINISNKKTKYWSDILKFKDKNVSSFYWPINLIPIKTSDNLEQISGFINSFITSFEFTINQGLVNNLNSEKIELIKNFTQSFNEATKNVWDHSESWGMSSFHSNNSNNNTLCIFDFGIGFIQSYSKRKEKYIRTEEEDINVLKWLFKEGNTSNESSNHGHGLHIMKKFTDFTKGVMLIKTDCYSMEYNNVQGLSIKKSNYFPGTQIMINFK